MEFSKYRSRALKRLQSRIGMEVALDWVTICRLSEFSTHEIDNLCAISWKFNNPIEICMNILFDYVEGLIEKAKNASIL